MATNDSRQPVGDTSSAFDASSNDALASPDSQAETQLEAAPERKFTFSNRQRATLATAVTVLSVFVIVCAVAALLWLVGAFFNTFSHVFLPLAVAGIIAMMLKPYYDWFEVKLKLPSPIALVAVFVAILIPLVALVWALGDIVVEQTSDLFSKIPEWWQAAVEQVQLRWPQLVEEYDIVTKLTTAVEGKEGALLSALRLVGIQALSAGAGVFGALGSLAGWAVLPVYIAFFLLIDLKSQTTSWSNAALPFLKAETRENITYLVNEFVEIIVAFFRGQFVIAFLQGILFAIGFSIVGLRYGLILGILLGFLNVIPYLGSIVGLGVALPLALFQDGGGWSMVLGVLVVFTIVQTIEGYVLTPRIMGEQTGLHPMAIIVAIFFWGSALNGITGIILAIPLTAFFVVFWRLLQDKYIRELV
ncbi:MAG: AI-2E family transporter [Acidobacteriota bacterium]